MKKNTDEYDRFENLTRQLLRVPHSEIRAKLDAEKAAKKRKKPKKSSASREASDPA
jgi:hypothetical protein